MHTQQQLKVISDLIKKLDQIEHPDSSRIAKEIADEYKFDPKQIEDVMTRISEGEPWEYIRGYSIFRGQKFIVNRDVLIPRIETEQLVEIAIQLQRKYSSQQIIDVGTGSGAIICSLAHELKEPNFTAIDVSGKALQVAKANTKFLGLKNINFVQNHLLNNFELKSQTIIVANLPYVTLTEYESLPDSVKDFEPKVALVGGEDGAVLIKEMLQQILLQEDKIDSIALEMDSQMIPSIKNFAEKFFKDFTVRVVRDFANKKRFIVIER